MTDNRRQSDDRNEVADGRYTAVLDRFEETDPANSEKELAVLLLESDEAVVAERLVPKWRLPEDARHQNAVLELAMRNGFVTSMEYDSEVTENRVESAQSRFDALAERPDENPEGESGR